MNGSLVKTRYEERKSDYDYDNLRQDAEYKTNQRRSNYETTNYGPNNNKNGEYFINNKIYTDKYFENSEVECIDNRKSSFLISELLHEDLNYKEYEEPLIETYNDMSKINTQKICEISLRLGCTSFGGPLAHQELIKDHLVKDNKIINEKHFDQILNLCLVLPGYSSSTLYSAIIIFKTKSILLGILSMLLFNLPSLVAVLVLSVLISSIKLQIHSKVENYNPQVAYFNLFDHPFYYLMMILSTGVTQAALGLMIHSANVLRKKLANSKFQFSLLILSGLVYFFLPNYILMVILIMICGLLSVFKGDHDYLLDQTEATRFNYKFSKLQCVGLAPLIFFFVFYAVLYVLNYHFKSMYTFLMESFFRIGALSFGEGHLIIPMILTEFTSKNLIEEAEILNGYALISLLPGSMFNLAAYSGVICLNVFSGIISSIIIFLPGLLIVLAALPYIQNIKNSNFLQFFIRGANSAAIGFLFTSTIHLLVDSCFINPYTNSIIGSLNVIICFILFESFKLHKPYVIIFGATFILFLTYTKLSIEA